MTLMFVSDLHLDPTRPDVSRAFIKLLQEKAIHCEALYLLGDIFEAWIGDDFIHPQLLPVIDALQALSATHCSLFFQHGNRDFLVGTSFCQRIGAQLIDEAKVVQLPTGQALIMHGDQLCLDDTEYLAFRAQVRHPQWQAHFLAQSIEQRLQIARDLREASAKRGAEKSTSITDVTQSAVIDALHEAQLELLIHGHTHRPAIHELSAISPSARRIVLGDWEDSLWYLQCDESGNHLIEQNISQFLAS